MENASKALLIAGGVLIAILIITLGITLFTNTSSVSKTYDASKYSEEVNTFNNNFTKYIGQDLTIHEVVTIRNFAENNNIKHVTVNSSLDKNNISEYIGVTENTEGKKCKYYFNLNIVSYNNGYVSEISFSGPKLKPID